MKTMKLYAVTLIGIICSCNHPQQIDIQEQSKTDYDHIQSQITEIESELLKDTPMGAWQACLLYKLWHNLPLFDHSCYNHRTYINHSSEITEVHSIQKNDDDYIHHVLEKLEPIQTIISQNGNKYYIERHYWNDWEGLVRELVEVSFENNTVSIFDVESTVEVKHDCGIRF